MAESRLVVADRWLLVGNLLTLVGTTCVGIGSILRLASSDSGLPSGKPVFAQDTDLVSKPVTRKSAEDYFSL